MNALYKRIMQDKTSKLRKKNLFRELSDKDAGSILADYPISNPIGKQYTEFFYSINGKLDRGYIPVPVYKLYIEPRLNKNQFAPTFEDKNSYDKFFDDIVTPATVLRKINGLYYDIEYRRVADPARLIAQLDNYQKLIIKPSVDSGAGKGILIFSRQNGEFRNADEALDEKLLASYPDFVLQNVVRQHEYFRQFNPDSNNTLRILTYRSVKDDQVHVLHRLLRVGKKGHFTDHDNLGGIAVGIDDNGHLNRFGTDYYGMKYQQFNDIDFATLPTEVPFLDDIEKTSISIARQLYYTRLLAIDFTVDDAGRALMLEINLVGNGINQYQMNNGSLFGDLTKEVLDYCL